ncbi:MAG: GTP cyclohydrolase, FolE2/MptA family [Methanoculleus sp.]|uniref:GTP cyclohydrolase, FolE2/MptA family n=1 Tax=Methanoculleus sp. TaxID=90427 RepID=UPI002634365A|nr:GTP cyclohydrolase, FolE2/MptA family [Methanoculleus sp.]MDD2259275.1 GTP cyclohydrolase, FolE2/MptA family [Bacilli bacterium]MDD4471756.1 GTP cyclohydrolase, FolE2/MptA family [Methanoculleus sp.]
MKTCVKFLPDVAKETSDKYRMLEKVGIKGVAVYRRDFNSENVLTSQSAYVSLLHSKGIHMSRLVKTLVVDYANSIIQPEDGLLYSLADGHDVRNAYWECQWESMHVIDDVQSVKIKCNLEGRQNDDTIEWFLTTVIPYTSICPCSADMTKEFGGIPHMQRAEAVVTGQLTSDCEMSTLIPTFVYDVLDAVKVYPIPYMKRNDELAWCQNADKYNYFVEDAARLVGGIADRWFSDWVIACEHFETIHQHNVVGVCRKDGGRLR